MVPRSRAMGYQTSTSVGVGVCGVMRGEAPGADDGMVRVPGTRYYGGP